MNLMIMIVFRRAQKSYLVGDFPNMIIIASFEELFFVLSP